MSSDLQSHLRRLGVVPVIVLEDAARAGEVARALVDGGLPCAEITFRTAAAADAIRRIAAERPDVLLGAGTVLTPAQADEARAAGAQFVVSPGFNARVVEYCQAHDVPVFPGVCTPTEIEAALELGLRVLKLFPAEPMGGVPFLEAIAAPYPGLEFMPMGGIDLDLLPAYVRCKRVLACGGSWIAPKSLIEGGAYDRIRETAQLATQAVAAARAAS